MRARSSLSWMLLLAATVAMGALVAAPIAAAHDGPGLRIHARRDGVRVRVALEADEGTRAMLAEGAATGERVPVAARLATSVAATTASDAPVALRLRTSDAPGCVLEGTAPDGVDVVLALSLFGTEAPGEALVDLDDGVEERLLRVELPGLVLLPWVPAARSTGRVESSTDVPSFVRSGVEHIVTGWDHLAFLLVLLVVGRRLRDVVAVASAFTLAHSLTLTLAALDLVRLPSAPVEAAIAASIVIAAVGNVLADAPRRRALLAFGFGLVHGLGFSSGLAEMLEGTGIGRVGAVLGFNLGVELGQLAVLLCVTPLLLAWRRRAPHAYALVGVRAGSLAIGALGLLWFAQRTLG